VPAGPALILWHDGGASPQTLVENDWCASRIRQLQKCMAEKQTEAVLVDDLGYQTPDSPLFVRASSLTTVPLLVIKWSVRLPRQTTGSISPIPPSSFTINGYHSVPTRAPAPEYNARLEESSEVRTLNAEEMVSCGAVDLEL
jgi:hypothetical protein